MFTQYAYSKTLFRESPPLRSTWTQACNRKPLQKHAANAQYYNKNASRPMILITKVHKETCNLSDEYPRKTIFAAKDDAATAISLRDGPSASMPARPGAKEKRAISFSVVSISTSWIAGRVCRYKQAHGPRASTSSRCDGFRELQQQPVFILCRIQQLLLHWRHGTWLS